MSEIVAIGAIGADAASSLRSATYDVQPLGRAAIPAASPYAVAQQSGFAELITGGLSRMDAKVANADRMVTQFALDGNTPIHHVTIALEEARLSVEMAMQVRQRLVEGYRELMNMQL